MMQGGRLHFLKRYDGRLSVFNYPGIFSLYTLNVFFPARFA